MPLKTYLPDGDIDLTAFSHDQNLKEIWANQVRDMLENEEKNDNAEFHVKEVQYIQAEVCFLFLQNKESYRLALFPFHAFGVFRVFVTDALCQVDFQYVGSVTI